jgi:hypothetical protein
VDKYRGNLALTPIATEPDGLPYPAYKLSDVSPGKSPEYMAFVQRAIDKITEQNRRLMAKQQSELTLEEAQTLSFHKKEWEIRRDRESRRLTTIQPTTTKERS